jgi:hypothetical protein
MKSTIYKGREITARPLSGYGHYELSARFYNREVTCRTNDSETYDWLNDSSNRHKHADAKRAALMMLQRAADSQRQERYINK